MVRLNLEGKTYGIKDTLKGLGFSWDAKKKVWYKLFNDNEQSEAEELANRWKSEDVHGLLVFKEGDKPKEKRYPVKESWIFNLESMHDKLWCLIYDVREGKIQLPFTVAGKVINSEDDLEDLQNEAETLEWKAKGSRGVTGKEYGRIRAIVAWRVEARYATCMAAGMNEADAGRCFEDM